MGIVLEMMTDSAMEATRKAIRVARGTGKMGFETADVLIGIALCPASVACEVLKAEGVLGHVVSKSPPVLDVVEESVIDHYLDAASDIVRAVYHHARTVCVATNRGIVGTEHILLGMLQPPGNRAQVMLLEPGTTNLERLKVVLNEAIGVRDVPFKPDFVRLRRETEDILRSPRSDVLVLKEIARLFRSNNVPCE